MKGPKSPDELFSDLHHVPHPRSVLRFTPISRKVVQNTEAHRGLQAQQFLGSRYAES